MELLKHPLLQFDPSPSTRWAPEDKPVVIVDGVLHYLKKMSDPITGSAAYVVGAGDKDLRKLVTQLQVEYLHFYELRAADLAPLTELHSVRYLKIHWNTKLKTLAEIGKLRALRALILVDTPKTVDLGPLINLTELTALEYSGGIWNRNRAKSLEPLTALPKLTELALVNLTVDNGGLRPLAGCTSLKSLSLSNQFETSDYAFLSIALPSLECTMLAPWVRVKLLDGCDTMIVGKRKPFLDSKKDSSKIAAYEAAFRHLQELSRVQRNT